MTAWDGLYALSCCIGVLLWLLWIANDSAAWHRRRAAKLLDAVAEADSKARRLEHKLTQIQEVLGND